MSLIKLNLTVQWWKRQCNRYVCLHTQKHFIRFSDPDMRNRNDRSKSKYKCSDDWFGVKFTSQNYVCRKEVVILSAVKHAVQSIFFMNVSDSGCHSRTYWNATSELGHKITGVYVIAWCIIDVTKNWSILT